MKDENRPKEHHSELLNKLMDEITPEEQERVNKEMLEMADKPPQPEKTDIPKEEKSTHAKPQLYAYYFYEMKDIAKEFGYNLVVHGSMNRDLDLIAIPWVDSPKPELEMIHALHQFITGTTAVEGHEKEIYLISKQPGGRTSYVINVNRGGYKKKL